ncbi:glycerophosphodiester phosphodiesterase family protein [Pseudoxanthomonas putridarboris]|uniref:Glycerophosphodiester phosphodiesterase family protein n=1 Tax=Pseudoxanthomonas putridarboris TaxID=752605 RepID=A0ABU9J447_9GAMM
MKPNAPPRTLTAPLSALSFLPILAAVLAALLAGCAAYPGLDRPSMHEDRAAVLRERLLDGRSGDVMIVAHRACWAEGPPENSLDAIASCIRMGVEMVEIDVAITRDGVPVLMHDPTLDRTTDGAGRVEDRTLAEIKALRLRRAAGGTAAPLTEERIPTLEQALRIAKGKILINLDVKGELFGQAFAVVERVGVADQILMKMDAFPEDSELLQAAFLHKTMFMPIIRECGIHPVPAKCSPRLSDIVPRYDALAPVAYELVFADLAWLGEGREAMREGAGRIWVNTLNPYLAAGVTDEKALQDPDANWGKVLDMGANMIQTDQPRTLIAYLESRKGLPARQPAERGDGR